MDQGWGTADYALVISLFSATISLASFFWNVWSRFLYPKPTVRVSVSFVLFDDARQQILFFPARRPFEDRLEGRPLILPAIRIYVTNFGPGEVKLGNPVVARRGKNAPKFEGYAQFNQFIKYPWQNPLTLEETRIESPLKPADDLALFVETSFGELLELQPTQIGFFDSFGRKHMCAKREVRHLLAVASAYETKMSSAI